ncbi:HlyD family efflux transporter periplasmic adaptor subunit [Ferrimonas marina]|uniref:HlyD family efflux transporter periplasmic adaptor subunit n=1 Tax=Ferrimonas marina TaxID=299255 RepID=UPI00082DA0DD|nr:HlyD family efflux transporter periplasmic adaptor subunit [Ferrimonas marina]
MFPPRTGILEQLHVEEGEQVTAGQPLATVVLRRGTSGGQELSERVMAELASQATLIQQELNQQQALFDHRKQRLEAQQQDLIRRQQALDSQAELMTEKLALSQSQLAQFERLFQRGHLSQLELQAEQAKHLALRQEQEHVQVEIAKTIEEVHRNLNQRSALPTEHALARNALLQRLSELKRQQAEAEHHYRYVLRAPAAGQVTAIAYLTGQQLDADHSVMQLIPDGAELIAELLLPSHSAGFVRPGDRALLRFDAFPYQRFGFVEAEVVQVDKALLSPGQGSLPFTLSGPVYRLKARLSQQQISADGEPFPLKPGMLLEADIQLEQRSLMAWLLAPLYGLQRRIG